MRPRQIALAATVLVSWLLSSRTLEAAASSSNLVLGFVGFNEPNSLGLPCAACPGWPTNVVLVHPNHFISSGSIGLYYAVFQENGWSGQINASFTLTGAGTVIQTVTLNGTINSGQDLFVLSGDTTIPDTAYAGPALLTVTAIATPNDGGSPFTLTSGAIMQIGTSGIRIWFSC